MGKMTTAPFAVILNFVLTDYGSFFCFVFLWSSFCPTKGASEAQPRPTGAVLAPLRCSRRQGVDSQWSLSSRPFARRRRANARADRCAAVFAHPCPARCSIMHPYIFSGQISLTVGKYVRYLFTSRVIKSKPSTAACAPI
jgi:hypothetical protein